MKHDMSEQTPVTLSEANKAHIDKWVAKFPADKKRSAVLNALMIVQDEHGWLSEPLMDAVADYLELPRVAVYEVATFYDMYNLEPVGKHKIRVCTNISCLVRGSEKVVEKLENKLGIKLGETTKDNQFTLCEVECLAACTKAPMMNIGKTYYEDLTDEKIDQIIDELAQ